MSLDAARLWLAAAEQRRSIRQAHEQPAAPSQAAVALPGAADAVPCIVCGAPRACAHRITATDKQAAFLRLRVGEALYGGGKGSGKTRALIMAPLYWIDDPRFRGLLLRREWKQAARTLLEEAKKVYPKLGGEWLAGRHVWRFPSGAEIEINGCDNTSDPERYYGTPELSFLGIDQLEAFTREMYLALVSCVRSAAGLPLVVRASANPGGIGQAWIVERWAPWLQPAEGRPWHDPQYPGPYAESGEALWYRTSAGEDGRDVRSAANAWEPECEAERRRLGVEGELCQPGRPCALHRPRSRTYVHAVISDNPYTAGTAYETNLLGDDPVRRAQFLGGNWMIRAEPGVYFDRDHMKPIDAINGRVLCRVRYWDRAGTEAARATKATAWTAGVRLALCASGLIVVEHVHRGQWDPGGVDAAILETAVRDEAIGAVLLAIEKDGGQAGAAQAYYDSRLLAGRDFVLPPPFKDKVTRMRPWSAQCRAGNVAVLRGAWNEAYWREHEGCPGGLWDQIDSSAGGMIQLLQLEEKQRGLRILEERRLAMQRAQTRQPNGHSIDGGTARLRGW